MKETTFQELILRRPTLNDLPEIQDIGVRSRHPLPDKFKEAAVIEKDGSIISFGVVRYIMEALLYCEGSDRDKVESLKQLIRQAKTDAISNSSDSIYVFAETEEFAKILEKHFSFRKCSGIPMILELK